MVLTVVTEVTIFILQYIIVGTKFDKEEYAMSTLLQARFGPDWQRGWVRNLLDFKIGQITWYCGGPPLGNNI